MKELLKIALKITAAIIVLTVICISAYFGYGYVKEQNKKKQELTFATTHKWKWHDEYDRVQVRYNSETKKSILRKVNLKKKYAIYAIKDNDYRLTTVAQFKTPCKKGTTINTSKKFSGGAVKSLYCRDGDYLVFSAYWSEGVENIRWEEDLDGFSFSENLTYWNMSKLDQEITLQKAK